MTLFHQTFTADAYAAQEAAIKAAREVGTAAMLAALTAGMLGKAVTVKAGKVFQRATVDAIDTTEAIVTLDSGESATVALRYVRGFYDAEACAALNAARTERKAAQAAALAALEDAATDPDDYETLESEGAPIADGLDVND